MRVRIKVIPQIIWRTSHSNNRRFSTTEVYSTTKNQSTNYLNDLLVNMPKEPTHISKLKQGRTNKKDVKGKYPAGFINLQVLGNGSLGSPSSLYVFTDSTRYLFNCGESTQRLAHEHKLKLAKLEHIFVTDASWRNTGGIPGVALTIQDIGVPEIALHGPPGLEKLFDGTRRFVILKDLQIQVSDATEQEADTYYDDHVISIESIPLRRKTADESEILAKPDEDMKNDGATDSEEDNIDYYAPIKGRKRNLQINYGGPKKSKSNAGITSNSQDYAISYICRPKRKAGALLIEKCIEHGVPTGPLLGRLKAGEDITLPNGNLVKAEDVRSNDFPSTPFLVVDCPHEDFLESFVENEKMSKYHGEVSIDNLAHIVVHFTPKEILMNPKYIDWMKRFPVTTKHLILSPGISSGMSMEAIHRAQLKLNTIDSKMFPLLKEGPSSIQKLSFENMDSLTKDLDIIAPACLWSYQLRPEIGPDDSKQVIFNEKEILNSLKEIPDFESTLKKVQEECDELSTEKVNEFPKIIFLGTGSCVPNKTRNTSAILVRISESSCIMLDCGEGTYGQLARYFGNDQVKIILQQLKGVYVSHLHADHHLGLLNIILRRKEAFDESKLDFKPVYLFAPHQIQTWLRLYHEHFEKIKGLYELIPLISLTFNEPNIDKSLQEKVLDEVALDNIETVHVRHCPNAFGVTIKGKDGWKLTYSGDTMPCDYLVTMGKDSDLLIHEATMEDDLADEAIIKMHSTVSQAISIGSKMNAKFIMLTHFSQRYAKVPRINELESSVGIAFDNMEMRLCDLPKIPKFFPLMKLIFSEEVEIMDSKSARKLLKKNWEAKKLTGTLNEEANQSTTQISS